MLPVWLVRCFGSEANECLYCRLMFLVDSGVQWAWGSEILARATGTTQFPIGSKYALRACGWANRYVLDALYATLFSSCVGEFFVLLGFWDCLALNG
jgi:hypothetical protein